MFLHCILFGILEPTVTVVTSRPFDVELLSPASALKAKKLDVDREVGKVSARMLTKTERYQHWTGNLICVGYYQEN
jgi:hypothetical protein